LKVELELVRGSPIKIMPTIDMSSRDWMDWYEQRDESGSGRANLGGNSVQEMVYVYKACLFPKATFREG